MNDKPAFLRRDRMGSSFETAVRNRTKLRAVATAFLVTLAYGNSMAFGETTKSPATQTPAVLVTADPVIASQTGGERARAGSLAVENRRGDMSSNFEVTGGHTAIPGASSVALLGAIVLLLTSGLRKAYRK